MATTPASAPTVPASAGASEGFEHLLGELDRLVTQLESGQLSLEDSLAAFERGMTVSKRAAAILDAAEARIEQLSGTPDRPVLRPLDEPL
ncbi:MAG: exodeoxyribonuclease VII small subunit [Myxococcales bacterium]|nr:exodeoxyribonuclease VII small subunit [Myxococcales bacterium]